MIKDFIMNKDRGETDADDEVRNLPFSRQKLKEVMLRSGVSQYGGAFFYKILSVALCLIFVFL